MNRPSEYAGLEIKPILSDHLTLHVKFEEKNMATAKENYENRDATVGAILFIFTISAILILTFAQMYISSQPGPLSKEEKLRMFKIMPYVLFLSAVLYVFSKCILLMKYRIELDDEEEFEQRRGGRSDFEESQSFNPNVTTTRTTYTVYNNQPPNAPSAPTEESAVSRPQTPQFRLSPKTTSADDLPPSYDEIADKLPKT
ncbi:CLUMA_CG009426, isoform A [Clunio marinus]|uniref:CLUMA_CG009426, isoform A n=1 Tax=Clunio marinus TaxID=568069 RepID=A0A1J1IC24_9DIPT|nr:CLUMA_CG009426, isoform A [Clunio marinus]